MMTMATMNAAVCGVLAAGWLAGAAVVVGAEYGDPAVFADELGRLEAGDGGRAVGPYQMWPCAVREVNRIVGRKLWTTEDRRNPQLSRAMCPAGGRCRRGRSCVRAVRACGCGTRRWRGTLRR